jgi:assimilatory nitrate reductase catalytic subunit
MNPFRRQKTGALTKQLDRAAGGFGLGQVPARLKPDATTSMVCGFCSTGCSLDVHLRDGVAVNLTPTTEYPVNLGMACPKGWEALTPLAADDRGTTPLWRDERGKHHAIGWDAAVGTFVERFRTILDEHGPESVAFLSTGQIPTEEMAFLGSLAKFGMGMLHGDGNTRQCMATSVVAYKESFGFDAPPYTYKDFEESDVIVLLGSNLCIAHPIMWERICRNPHNPEIIVVDPRTTETAVAATQHYPLAPKSDLTLLYGVAHVLVREGWIDKDYIVEHTSGYDDFADFVADFTPTRVADATGLRVADIERFAQSIHDGERVSFWWTMGVNQGHESTRTAQAIINLALMTGNMGRPGTGANSITGQCNAMGSRLFSNTTNLLGGRDFTKPELRQEAADVLGIDVSRIPDRASLAYDQIIDGVRAGKIKGLWIIATNSAHSWIYQDMVRDAFDKLDFLVVQDMYPTTETAQHADLYLPAAGWGEKEGTFINSERRVGLIKRVAPAPGQALSDFAIFRLIADAWGCGDMFAEWQSPEAVFRILQRLSEGRPCDITGIDGYEAIDRAGGVQWPYPTGATPAAERRLFEDGRYYHPDGLARFVFEEPRPVAEPTSGEYPLFLLTGRGNSAAWHTQTRTGKSPALRALMDAEPYVELSPGDAAARGLGDGDMAVITSPRGSMKAQARITPTVRDGQVFIPMHYATTNLLTNASFDKYSRQPSYKSGAVQVRATRGTRRTDKAPARAQPDTAVDKRIAAAPAAYAEVTPLTDRARHAQLLEPRPAADEVRVLATPGRDGTWNLDIVALDQPGLLARFTGVLIHESIQIQQAVLATWDDGAALQALVVKAPSEPDVVALQRALAWSLDQGITAPPVEGTTVEFDHTVSDVYTACAVSGPDRPGLLHAIAVAISNAGADIHAASVETRDGRAVDRFDLTDASHRKIEPIVCDLIRRNLAAGFSGLPSGRGRR